MESCIPCSRLYKFPQGLKETINDFVTDAVRHFAVEEEIQLRVLPRPIRILIVEDDIGIIESLKAVIESAGISLWQITMAHTGATALEIIKDNEIDLLFIDINLPDGLTGVDVLKYAKLKKPDSSAYIITGQATIGELEDAIQLGAIDILLKPFNPVHVIEIIEDLSKKR